MKLHIMSSNVMSKVTKCMNADSLSTYSKIRRSPLNCNIKFEAVNLYSHQHFVNVQAPCGIRFTTQVSMENQSSTQYEYFLQNTVRTAMVILLTRLQVRPESSWPWAPSDGRSGCRSSTRTSAWRAAAGLPCTVTTDGASKDGFSGREKIENSSRL